MFPKTSKYKALVRCTTGHEDFAQTLPKACHAPMYGMPDHLFSVLGCPPSLPPIYGITDVNNLSHASRTHLHVMDFASKLVHDSIEDGLERAARATAGR